MGAFANLTCKQQKLISPGQLQTQPGRRQEYKYDPLETSLADNKLISPGQLQTQPGRRLKMGAYANLACKENKIVQK